MKFYRKWILTLGIAAVTPGIVAAGPLSFWKSEKKPASKATAVDNQKMAEQVADKLRAARLSGFDIEIEVKNGVCLLNGKIANANQKRQASQLASSVAGIGRVDNRLSVLDAKSDAPAIQQAVATDASRAVRRSAPAKETKKGISLTGFFKRKGPSDQDVANNVGRAVGALGLRGHDMNVRVKNGICTISGKVRSPREIAAVTQAVSRVPGIKQVVNKLGVPGQQAAAAPKAPGSNQAMAEIIAGAIGRSPLANEDIEVRFNSGVVTLNGSVSSPQAAQMAYQIAAVGPGVRSVNNNLKVVAGAGGPQFGPALGQHPAGQRPGAPIQQVGFQQQGYGQPGPGGMIPPLPAPAAKGHGGRGASHLAYDLPQLPDYAWPSYSSYPNYASLTYPTEYSASAWPYIGPFYPYPQVPLGWRQVQMEWDDGYWSLNFRPRTDRWFWYLDPKNW